MLQSVKDFAEKKEKYALKKSAHRDDHDRPREKIGDLQIRFGVVELAADASRHNADDLRRDARFPAEPERDAAAREQGGAQRRKENAPDAPARRETEHVRHFQKVSVGGADTLQQICIQYRKDHQKGDKRRQRRCGYASEKTGKRVERPLMKSLNLRILFIIKICEI